MGVVRRAGCREGVRVAARGCSEGPEERGVVWCGGCWREAPGLWGCRGLSGQEGRLAEGQGLPAVSGGYLWSWGGF